VEILTETKAIYFMPEHDTTRTNEENMKASCEERRNMTATTYRGLMSATSMQWCCRKFTRHSTEQMKWRWMYKRIKNEKVRLNNLKMQIDQSWLKMKRKGLKMSIELFYLGDVS
jgi:hypothetical protein